MNTAKRSISEINRQAAHILFKEMGVVETIRFLNQFSAGRGDYTKDRSGALHTAELIVRRFESGRTVCLKNSAACCILDRKWRRYV